MTTNLKFGLLMHPLNTGDWPRFHASEWDRKPDVPDHQIWAEMKACGLLAEPLGFDSLWVTEHHVTPYGLGPDPLEVMAYFAGKTESISLGTAVVVLPWHHPVRVAEEIALLDSLSGGRDLQIGFGRGVAPREFAHLQIDQNESRQRFDEGVEIIKLALTEDTFSYDGEVFHIPETHVRPQPRNPTAIVDNFLCAFGSPVSLQSAASRGLRPAFTQGKPPEEIREQVIEYNRVRIANGYPAVQPMVAQWLFCAETEEEAWEGAVQYMGANSLEINFHYEIQQKRELFATIKGYEHYAELGKIQAEIPLDEKAKAEAFAAGQVWGTPDMIIQKLQEIQDLTAAQEIICQFKYGGMPMDRAEKSLRLFAKEVLPALQKVPATFHDWADPSRGEKVGTAAQ